MKLFAEKLLTPGGWRENRTVIIENGVIQAIESGAQGDVSCPVLAPGLFDIHCHGGEGFHYALPDRTLLEKYLLRLARCGVTDLLYTTGSLSDYEPALSMAAQAMRDQAEGKLGGARIHGVHLEGPFLSRKRPGAMNPDMMPAPSPEAFMARFEKYMDVIRLVSVAPENEGAKELIEFLLRKGICVQAGHTDATCAQADEAFGWGVNSLCHTFNAARGIHHREPGVVTAALLDENVYCEAICDFHHLHPSTVKLIYRMKGPERMVVISDSTTATGLPDGEHVFGAKTYLVVNGTPCAANGTTLSGGACYLDGCVRNLVSIGIPAENALVMASRTPARRLKCDDSGLIAPGKRAHLAAFDGQYNPLFTFIDGKFYHA